MRRPLQTGGGRIEGTDAIRYWDGSDWAPITAAVRDVDYALEYIRGGGDLDGYTVLTVPEPATMSLLGLGFLAIGAGPRRRMRRRSISPCSRAGE